MGKQAHCAAKKSNRPDRERDALRNASLHEVLVQSAAELKEAKKLNDTLGYINMLVHSTFNIDEIIKGVIKDGTIAIGAESAMVLVHDNGIGIDPKFKDYIFMVFQRLHRRGEFPGTGMDLAICRKIVDRHGGRIWVDSKLNEGASFYFTLPAWHY
ncbi:MAG: ATP-binding protein [Desulfobulbaceae bacterium]|nr:ATP-binding protein [Desulfobulbaceae bacterium]